MMEWVDGLVELVSVGRWEDFTDCDGDKATVLPVSLPTGLCDATIGCDC